MSRLRLLALAGAALIAGAWSVCVVPAQEQPSILQLLDRYAAGDHDGVRRAFEDLDSVDDARRTLEREGRAWTARDDPAEAARRRLIAATFALELAEARMQDEWRRLRSLVEWGCELVRTGPPTEPERLWHLASVALAQGARDWEVLYSSPPPVRVAAYNHLSHARGRFREDIRLQFADAVVQAIRTASGFPAHRGSGRPRWKPRAEALRARFEAIDYLQTFLADPIVGGEAALRTGLAWLGLERVDEALRHFEIASHSDDEFSAYLAHVFAGQVQDRYGTPAEAAAQYRSALDVIPRAQSASLPLSTLLLADGRPDEAYDVVRLALEQPMPPDPWRVYGLGSYYHYPDYVRRLRQVLGS
jgi:tetratricopeptide (TPR) repeat protein